MRSCASKRRETRARNGDGMQWKKKGLSRNKTSEESRLKIDRGSGKDFSAREYLSCLKDSKDTDTRH